MPLHLHEEENRISHISTGTAPPTTTPSKVGDKFIDTTNKKVYTALGTSGSGDWEPIPSENTNLLKTLRATFNHDSVSPVSLGTLPANSFVIKTETFISTFFNGTSPTIELGTAIDKDLVFNSSHVNLKMVGDYTYNNHSILSSSDETIQLDYIADGSTAGSGDIVLYYV